MDDSTFRDEPRGPGLSDLSVPALIAAALVVLSLAVDIFGGLSMTP